jgi:hypothetical protein
MTKQQLLKKAIDKCLNGTKCICLSDDEEYTITGTTHHNQSSTEIWLTSGVYGVKVYNKGKWAKIVKS